ncbi:MAG: hypothetical protein IJW29_08355 [Clostridia bacterium]|nr:hypothetical protein [Clostridia bacterium]
MTIADKLDLAIKLKETGTTDGAYVIERGNSVKYSKKTYMTKEEWKAFEADMKANDLQPNAHTEYSKGGGDELTEKNGRPPKMASYGSSSRMIYNLSRNKAGFHYEKKLSTSVGGTANLDGFCNEENRYIFVEAKCREPYSKKNNSVSTAYKELYDYINIKTAGSMKISMIPSKCGRYMNVDYFAGDEKLEHFDIKQMICHLLGIATGLLKGILERKQIDFIYLLYDPTELDMESNAKAQIDRIYERTCYECNLVDFSELFCVILNFLRAEKYAGAVSDDEIDEMILKFTFSLASQELYPILLP